MNDRKRPSPPAGEYSVGYGHPPQQTQFQPGRSGNPKGRPKGSRSVGAILQEIIRQKHHFKGGHPARFAVFGDGDLVGSSTTPCGATREQ